MKSPELNVIRQIRKHYFNLNNWTADFDSISLRFLNNHDCPQIQFYRLNCSRIFGIC